MDCDKSKELCQVDDSDECHESHGHKYFGIKSYLHNFYENVRNPSDLDDFDDDSSISRVKDGRNKRSRCWSATLIAGFLTMFGGATLVLVGYTFPRMDIDIGYQEEMRVVDVHAIEFNEKLELLKIIGLGMFAIGGIFVASVLLLPSLLCVEYDGDESSHFKLRIHDDDDFGPDAETRNLIPITEELKVVQPRGESTIITTKAGLKQID